MRHSGDFGDIIAAMCVIKEAEALADVFLVNRPVTKHMTSRAQVIIPLLKSQDYIGEVECSEAHADWRAEDFRDFHSTTASLAMAQSKHAVHRNVFTKEISGVDAWLKVEPDTRSKGRVVVARSVRYHNPLFPWREILRHYGERVMFIGTTDDWGQFCNEVGKVQRERTESLLDAARLIAGSELCISNQTSLWWLAEGLKHRRIQETCLWVCDSIMPGGVVQHCADGAVTLPDVSGSEVLEIAGTPRAYTITSNSLSETPPGGWQAMGQKARSLRGLLRILAPLHPEKDLSSLRNQAIMENVDRVPDFFMHRSTEQQFNNVRAALKNAGITDHPLFSSPQYVIKD